MTDLKTVVAERFKIPVKQASASILHHACRVTPPGEKAFLTSDPDTEVTPGTVIVTPSLSGNVTIEVK